MEPGAGLRAEGPRGRDCVVHWIRHAAHADQPVRAQPDAQGKAAELVLLVRAFGEGDAEAAELGEVVVIDRAAALGNREHAVDQLGHEQ